MPKIGFADESGTDPKSACYAIGVLLLDSERVEDFNQIVADLRQAHGVPNELKWTKIGTSHGEINLLLHVLEKVLKSGVASFDAMVVNKSLYRNWQTGVADREKAFYQTYTFLLRHILNRVKDTAEIFIDDRSDSYDKQHEVVETIGNRMLSKLQSSGRLASIKKADSKETPGIQVADLITGAIVAGHNLHLNPGFRMHHGKGVALARVAQSLGWDRLCYDTYPEPQFNVWHFPIEYRATPATVKIVPASQVPFVCAADLEAS
jgi:hypothetical protein